MANTAYYLKRSRVAIVFQICILILILSLVFILLPLWLACIALVIVLLSFWLQLQQTPLYYFEPFSLHEWSVAITDQQVTRMQLQRVVDHHWYVVLYFHQQKSYSYVIWYDQLALKDWKKLKLLAKML
jgi:hypothetical protein